MIARDGMAHLIRMVEIIILEKLQKLQDSVKDQVFWLVRELVQTHVIGADILCYALLKQMPAGSTSRGDIWLVESLLHLLLDNRSWLESQPALVDSVLYTYLSLIPSHFTAKLATLREQETGLCVSLLRSKFMDRIQIGRDLIRLLQNVARIPEFSELWRDILQFPEKLSSQFTGVSLLATKRTSRRFISGRITPELEIKLNFLLSKRHLGGIFPQSTFVSPGGSRCRVQHNLSQSRLSDIRKAFDIYVVSPLNSYVLSAVVTTAGATSEAAELRKPTANDAKCTELGWVSIPLVVESYQAWSKEAQQCLSQLSTTLIPSYCPALDKAVECGVKMALTDILHKGVLPSFDTLFDSPKLDSDLKAMLKANFFEFYPQGVIPHTSCSVEELNFADQFALDSSTPEETVITISDDDLVGEDDEVTSAFSDVEGNESEGFQVITEGSNEEDSNSSAGDGWTRITELQTELQEKLLTFREERNSKQLDECLEQLEKSAQNEGALMIVALLLADLLSDDFSAGCSLENEADAQSRSQDPFLPYSEYVEMFREPFAACVVRDLKECVENESTIFYLLLPDVFKQFHDKICGVPSLLNMIVANIDPVQWDSFEQFCVWQLLSAEGPDVQTIIIILEKLSLEEHPEAFSSALLLLKCEPLGAAALGALFSLPVSTHCGVVDAVGSHWLNLNPSKYAKYLSQLMDKTTVQIDTLLEHLTRVLVYLNSNHIFEVSEHVLTKSLLNLFTSFPEFLVKFESLYRVASTYADDIKKKSQGNITKVEQKSKKRKVMNIDDLLDA
ncbi:hypothetical protein EMCRGX_G011269 [Ephydatia muelleri]